MNKGNWIWMPHAGHFICSRKCQFHLNTYVNGYIISTVGEYWPDSSIRKIIAESKKIIIEGKGDIYDRNYMKLIGYEQIGYDRLYETMVFYGIKDNTQNCCPYTALSFIEIEMNGYNESGQAYEGHLEMCKKYDKLKRK